MMDNLIKNMEYSNKRTRPHRSLYPFKRNRNFKGYYASKYRGDYKPLIDVFDNKDEIVVLIEAPAVRKDDIDLYATEDTLTISICNEDRKFYHEIPLPARVNPKSACASYKNRVLKVRFKKTSETRLLGGQKILVS